MNAGSRPIRYERAAIAAVGWDLGPEVVTSAAIEDRLAPVYQRIGLHAGRLELMTGIRERRFYPVGERPSAIATRAGAMALERSGIDPGRIGLLVHASVCRDFAEPATANVVHSALGLPKRAQVFDVSNACLGVMNGILLAANMIELGQIEAALIVAGEDGRPLVESTVRALLEDPTIDRRTIKPSFASLTTGAGGAGVVVTTRDRAAHRLLGGVVRAATEHHVLCQGADTRAMSTDAEALLHAGVALAKETWAEFVEVIPRAPDRVLTHQVGKAHHQALFTALGLDPNSSFVTYDHLGNVGSVSLPITLGHAVERGFVAGGQQIALLGIGSGLSSIMLGVEW